MCEDSIIEAVSVLKLQEGDILVLRTPKDMRLTDAESGRLRQGLESAIDRAGMKDKVWGVVLQEGLDLEVVRPDKLPRPKSKAQ